MKLPAVLRRTPKALDVIQDEGVAMQARAASIGAEIAQLDEARPAFVLDGEPDDIVAHDARRARLVVELEQCSARLGRLDTEQKQAEAEHEQARRRKLYADTKKMRAEGVAAVAAYERAAEAVAAALTKLYQVECRIADANDQLPDGAAFIEPAEPDNSIPATPDKYHAPEHITPTVTKIDAYGCQVTSKIADGHLTPGYATPGRPGRPHQSIRDFARLPKLKQGEFYVGR